MAREYEHSEVEQSARKKWQELGLYQTDLSDTTKDPYYLLVEFPYPSGDLHIGHWYAFAVTDIYARMLRARGKNVLFPIGFDAFGLPAENAAIKHGVDPRAWTLANIERMRGQLESMGASFDWSKQVVACEPEYYHWTQWLFTKLFEHGLAERRTAPVKWCPKDQTVLANEQVVDGKCERCGTEVEEKNLTQWFLKITQYADRLLKNLDTLPWREEIKDAQRAWIGKSEGAYLTFALQDAAGAPLEQKIKVFTTRPDTVFGVTYVVVAPELIHELSLGQLENTGEVRAYVEATKKKTERERSENKEKTGVELKGVKAINPANGEAVPVFVADYVLGSYGTGAVMAVPAHDERDFEFAQKYHLPIRTVIEPLISKTDGPDAVRPDEPEVERQAITAIVRNPENGKYLALRWKKANWTTFVTGGIEEGQTAEEAARAEVKEETGYTNLKLIRRLTNTHSRFYHIPKKQNRFGHFATFLFELDSTAPNEVAQEEKEKHDPVWLTKEELNRELEVGFLFSLSELNGSVAYTGDGLLANSGVFDGKNNREAMWDIVAAADGEKTTQYRLRDWLVSRQRYWGCPIPVVYDPEGKPHTIPAEHLPWLLPTDVDFTPTGKAPLASSQELKDRVTKIFGEGWTPEFDTLDTFVDSSWYFTRYLDPHDPNQFSDQALMKKWLPVNRYSGGSEHTTMHLLYARFFMMALYDLSLVPVQEPFSERFNRGLIMGPDGQKMSKSKGNVVNPDEFVQKFGADAVRIYLAFIGPYNEPGSYPWQLEGVSSMRKFLERVIRLTENGRLTKSSIQEEKLGRAFAQASAKIASDGDRFKLNTGVAALMTLLNTLEKMPAVPARALREYVILLAPFAPHLCEHLWEALGGEGSVHTAPWPVYDAALLENAQAEVVVQVNGKKRGTVALPAGASEAEALAAARELSAVAAALAGSEPKRIIYRSGTILNIVV